MGRPRKPSEQDMLIAIESGVAMVGNTEYSFRRGVTRVRAGHPLAKACPQFFEPIKAHYEIETMTAAPGERRGE